MGAKLSDDQQDVVALLTGELAELVEQDMVAVIAEGGDLWREEVSAVSQHLEHVGNAAELAGLPGLAACCHHLATNFSGLAGAAGIPSDDCLAVLPFWGIYLLGYLQAVGDDDLRPQAAADLLMLLSDPSWPAPLPEPDVQVIQQQLSSAAVVIDDAPEGALPESVSNEMLSVAVPDDVRSELLQGLLVELPAQVRQLETSVTTFLETRDASCLATMQRLAHTVKGSANVVGIPGLANLMHYAEDMLENIARQPASITADFELLLQDTVDCFAAMAEAVAGIGPPPADARSVMERLVASVRELREQRSDGKPCSMHDDTGASAAAAPISDATPVVDHQKEPEDEPEPQQMLSIADTVAHELLRLMGETQITNTQASAQIDELAGGVKAALAYQHNIKSLSSELEQLLELQGATRAAREGSVEDQMDPLEFERYNELHSFSHKLLELATDAQESIERVAQQVKKLRSVAFSQQQLNKDSQQLVLELRMVPVSTLSSRFSRCVRQANRMTGKAAELTLEGDHILMDSRVLQQMADPIMHLLRNAVDHGLEGADERVSSGKPEQGQIHLSFAHQGETIVIQCRDDGRGLDNERIASVARSQGLVGEELLNDPQKISQLIMLPGFSTRETVSQTSGRGIGLDAVLAQVKELKGSVTLESEPGAGTCFTLTVPASVLSGHALHVRTRGARAEHDLCIVTRSIEQIIYLAPGEAIASMHGGNYEVDGETIPVVALNEIAHVHAPRSAVDGRALLLTRRRDGSRCGVLVDAVVASQNLVIKPLGRFAHRPAGVIGATILGNGAVAPVLDLQELPGLGMDTAELAQPHLQQRHLGAEQDSDHLHDRPMALVVDDSLSARRALAQFITDLGMDVRTARDGFEAINVVEQRMPALMLVDLEMPRMNGLELTSHIRSRDATKDIPIIMVTSRSTDRHRQLANAAGVDGYLNKPWSEDELLALIQQHTVETL